ncbi:hypothetical protein [Pararhodobacter zhoushanensis]|uniref:Uncharacterized protein n=1 Tax=Pararhodobacter zhoushanensis TaxID=2479545 RepID=A0ABT3GZQ2_9RHOB|nr:hypothetical protein [Pararhodobacter zhoushanensis]MCW1933039.1 hypothetical protein [Pararhodobacter zhoushanensis]
MLPILPLSWDKDHQENSWIGKKDLSIALRGKATGGETPSVKPTLDPAAGCVRCTADQVAGLTMSDRPPP